MLGLVSGVHPCESAGSETENCVIYHTGPCGETVRFMWVMECTDLTEGVSECETLMVDASL